MKNDWGRRLFYGFVTRRIGDPFKTIFRQLLRRLGRKVKSSNFLPSEIVAGFLIRTKYDSCEQVTQESKQNASKRDQNQKLELLVAAVPQDRWESKKPSQKPAIRTRNKVFSKQPLAFNLAAI
jgi:hypothetical protein